MFKDDDPETPALSEHPVCSLCGAKGTLDHETVRCVSSSTWQLSYKYTFQGTERAKSEELKEISDPREWIVWLRHDCLVAECIHAKVDKAKQLAAKVT
jgi:hypothetical protein